MTVLRQGYAGQARQLPQIVASDPERSAFVTANAGTGKTWTLVARVARLLLRHVDPAAILCVTYTKAAAAEMQRRLFEQLGAWAVANDTTLRKALGALDEPTSDLARARRLFARALETPGGLKIQTIHAFCETLLKRFPLEAGVSPTFQVLEDAEAQLVAAHARDQLAEIALDGPDGVVSRAYSHFSVELDFRRFNDMFVDFAARRGAICAYAEALGDAGWRADVWWRCGFGAPEDPEAIERAALAEIDWNMWRRATEALSGAAAPKDQKLGAAMAAVDAANAFADVWALFATTDGAPLKDVCTRGFEPGARGWLVAEQLRLGAALDRARAARVARDTCHAITLAVAYARLYEAEKAKIGALDFADLIQAVARLLTVRADAAWVLYKLDGGIEHVLLDEAQDTAPEQWAILSDLTGEFFVGAGRPRRGDAPPRTMFAVGDEKQSIYSFQGAKPERFDAEARRYRERIEGAGERFVSVPLEQSRRSTEGVLTFVDAVFADHDAAAGLGAAGLARGPLHHVSTRDDSFGAVDIWPQTENDPTDAVEEWWMPVDARPGETAAKKLARRVAQTVKAMIADRAAVWDKDARANRAGTAGDFLILVRRRNALFHEIIRALKSEAVPTGGADRLALSEHIAFKDLMALGRFARFPADDLTLAALLRSPFCEVDQDGLFDLAYGRQSSLWAALNRRAGEHESWRAARDFLAWARAQAAEKPPFDFYSGVLSRLDGRGRSMRERLLTRFGREAEDAIEAFLGEALALERRRIHDLERFLDEMARTDLVVKREAEDSQGEVRVMTAHGAKGLEAPVVILPDTTTRATPQGSLLLETGDGGFLWAPRKADDCPASAAARALRETAVEHESLRLLYVALTRARDRLIIAGAKPGGLFERSWYDVVSRALERPEIKARLRVIEGEAPCTRFGDGPAGPAPRVRTQAELALRPAWAARPAPAELRVVRYAQPSTLADSEAGPAPSPLAARLGLGRFRRGILVHQLLQLLPDLPEADRAAAAMRLLAREPDLTHEQRREMADAALAVLADERFAAVFGPGSRAEVAIAGGASSLPAALKVSGRIDRLVVGPERVLVVDFKSNRPAPERIDDADPAYLTQMALYVAVLEEVFPGRAVEAALVWTDGPKLMAVPEKMVRETLARLKTEG
jgi:ATP-dependent helicase/nuclease subunit A